MYTFMCVGRPLTTRTLVKGEVQLCFEANLFKTAFESLDSFPSYFGTFVLVVAASTTMATAFADYLETHPKAGWLQVHRDGEEMAKRAKDLHWKSPLVNVLVTDRADSRLPGLIQVLVLAPMTAVSILQAIQLAPEQVSVVCPYSHDGVECYTDAVCLFQRYNTDEPDSRPVLQFTNSV